MRKKLFPSAMLLCAALLIGCGGNNTYSPDVQGGGGGSFALTVTPASQTVTNGGSTTYTVTATSSGGFSTPVNLSISGVPAGGTAAFAPATITPNPGGANSTLTINTAGGTGSVAGTIRSPHRGRDVDPGAYTLTITATGGGVTQQRQVQLNVQAPGGGGGVLESAIYVGDGGNHRIVRINDMSGAGWVSFGTAGSSVGQFSQTLRVTLDGQGRIYVADVFNHRIVRMNDMTGAGWVSIGTQGSGVGQFNQPWGVAVDGNGRIYIADAQNGRVVRFDDMSGAGWTTYGTKVQGFPDDPGEFDNPVGISISPTGRIYVTDSSGRRVVRVDDMAGSNFAAFQTLPGLAPLAVDSPLATVEGPDSKIYVADTGNRRLVRVDDMTGANAVELKGPALGIGELAALDMRTPSNGRLYFVSTTIQRVDNMSGSGYVSFGNPNPGSGVGQFNGVNGIYVVSAP